MASNTKKVERRRRRKEKNRGKDRKRRERQNPPRTLPLDEAPSGAEARSK